MEITLENAPLRAMGILVELGKALRNKDEYMILKLPHSANGNTTRLFGKKGGCIGEILQDSPTVARFKTVDVQQSMAEAGFDLTYG